MEKILLVMREDATRDTLYYLWKDRYELLVCGCAEEGAALLRQKPDALVLDLFLPGEDGLTLLKKTIPERPPVTFALSELVNSDVLEECRTLGVDCLFIKPCSCAAVTRKLNDVLKNSKKSPLP